MKLKQFVKQFKEEWKTLPKPKKAFMIFTWLFVIVFFSIIPKAIYDNHMTTVCLKDEIKQSCERMGGSLLGSNIWVVSSNRTYNNSLNITPDYYCNVYDDSNPIFPKVVHEFLSDGQIEKCQRE